MYSIYKKLPNDTDLTVFRKDANINGFNFAFIGDHFNYHTAQDSYERLDRESLLHQADYFTTSLNYFKLWPNQLKFRRRYCVCKLSNCQISNISFLLGTPNGYSL
jgi:hypothetical protein